MARRLDSLVPHLPAALLLLFGGGAGTFSAGAEARWAIGGHLALLIFVGALGEVWPDPLRLGRGRLLLAALILSVLASYVASPVARAGRLAILLLPAFLMVPSAVARCWSSERARRLGLRSVSLVVGVVACWSIFDAWRFEQSGTAQPLGHHGLLAAWLLVTLPLAMMPWRDRPRWGEVVVLVTALGGMSLLATRSLAAALAAGVVVVVALARNRRRIWLAMGLLGILGAAQASRLGGIVSGSDTSVAARWSYLQAAWRGWLERPMLGWGPGSSRWTLAEHLSPVPGVHTPEQVVADPHSLPFLIGYELGWSGLLLALGVVWVWLRRRPEIIDPGLRRAAWAGLAALAVMSCAGRPLAAPAIPLAAMIAAGAVLASEARPKRQAGRGPALAVAMAMAVFVMPLDLAQLAYDRAITAESVEARKGQLRRAVELDPEFPLYGARLAWLDGDHERALTAARDARGVAALWLVAGMLGQDAGEAWSRKVLLGACRLSPLGVVAPYRLTFQDSSEAERAEWTARALLAEPLVSAAVAWRDRGSTLRAAAAALGDSGVVDPGWRAWLEQILEARENGVQAGKSRILALAMDGDPATSVSLYAFRRRPWPIDLARIEIDAGLLASVDPGAAAPLTREAAEIFRDPLCGLGR